MLPVIKPSLKPKGVKITAPVHTLLQPVVLICLFPERQWSCTVMCLLSFLLLRSNSILSFVLFQSVSSSLPTRTMSRSLYSTAAGSRSSSGSEWMVKGRSVSHLERSIVRHGSSEHNLFSPHHFTGQNKRKQKMDRNWNREECY